MCSLLTRPHFLPEFFKALRLLGTCLFRGLLGTAFNGLLKIGTADARA
jgi:hypothetical protein